MEFKKTQEQIKFLYNYTINAYLNTIVSRQRPMANGQRPHAHK